MGFTASKLTPLHPRPGRAGLARRRSHEALVDALALLGFLAVAVLFYAVLLPTWAYDLWVGDRTRKRLP